MPFYTYECTSCSYTEDRLLPMNCEKTVDCPKCNERTFTKLLSRVMISMGKRYPDAPSTPVDDMSGPTIRIPEYADRNTGQKLGFGQPEFLG